MAYIRGSAENAAGQNVYLSAELPLAGQMGEAGEKLSSVLSSAEPITARITGLAPLKATIESGDMLGQMRVGVPLNAHVSLLGAGGATDYNVLENKPTINSVMLTGELTPEELGIMRLLPFATQEEILEIFGEQGGVYGQ